MAAGGVAVTARRTTGRRIAGAARAGAQALGPWLTPMLVAVEVALVWSGVLALGTAVLVGVAVEAALAVTVAGRTVAAIRRFRRDRRSGLDAWAAAEAALGRLVPRRLARLLLLEVRLWACLAAWAASWLPGRGRPSPAAYGYHRGLRTLWALLVGLGIVEGGVVEVVVALAVRGSPWPWVVLGVHLYALGWLLGFYASLVRRPHVLDHEVLRLRDGVLGEVTVPYAGIAGVRAVRRHNFGRSGLTIDPGGRSAVLAVADATVRLDLDPAVPPRRDGVPLRALTELAVTVDRPPEFVAALRARMATKLPAGPLLT